MAPFSRAKDPKLTPLDALETRTPQEIAEHFGVDAEQGLSAAEAERRLNEYGPNELRTTERESAFVRFLRQFADPLVYLLLVAIGISVVAWAAEGAEGLPIDGIVVAVIVLANAVLGFVQENKAADAVAALSAMTATRATVLRDGLMVSVPASEIVVGDVLVLGEGDAVGADARLVSATSLQVQEASLTGESTGVTKSVDTLDAPQQIGDRVNLVFKGTAVARGVGRAIVTRTGMDTEMGRVATLLDATESEPSPLEREIARVSRTLGILVIAIAVVVMLALVLVNGVHSVAEAIQVLLLGVSLAVAAVPEGLPAILSLVLAIGVRVLAQRNAVMKDLHSAETLGSVSVIASDKTGTLTKNEMTVREVVTASGRVTLEGVGYTPKGKLLAPSLAVLAEAALVLNGGARANNAQLAKVDGSWQIQGDPTEAAFLVAERKLEAAGPIPALERLGEVPFSSERKMMSVIGRREDGTASILAKGAPDVLLDRCASEYVDGSEVPLTAERRDYWQAQIRDLAEQGYRTLGVALRDADECECDAFDDSCERDLVFVGVASIIDPARDESVQAIAEAHGAGIKVVMITGDHPITAARIAQDLGIVGAGEQARTLTGAQLDAMDAAALVEAARDVSVYARVSPEHKLRIIAALREGGAIVSMTGDGVNDAPALKSADIGIAMGITGTEVTKQASHMILGDDNYATIVAAVRQGRVIFDNIKKFMRYLLSSNMGEVATIFLGVVFGGLIGLADPANPAATVVPLLATQILWVNLVTDSGPALAMGVDPEVDDVMARAPRRPDARVIDGHMWSRMISIGLVMGVVNLVIYDLMLPGGFLAGMTEGVPESEQLAVARTTVFTSLVMMQLFNALNSRSDMSSAFTHLFSNRWLWISFAVAIVAQIAVVEVPLLQSAFGTVGLDTVHWLIAVAAGAFVLAFEEVVKVIRRRVIHR